ncbi:MAG: hypothetical protein JWQ21_636 [Herminiimonas sp.]|nr:hypothetical protein [Herminiimonas sp.]
MQHAFLVQRYCPQLRIAGRPSVLRNERGIPVFCKQGLWDGACGLYCAAMALALLGYIPNVKALPFSRTGVAQRLWAAGRENYFDGLTCRALTATLAALDTDLRIRHCAGGHRRILSFMQERLSRSEPVIVSWRTRNNSAHHWVLAIGLQGWQAGRTFSADTVLVIDPDANEPQFSGCNGWLRFNEHPAPRHAAFVAYESNDDYRRAVTLTGAIALQAG